jgi:hypothetical protein
MNEDDIEYINENILGFPYTLKEFLDHTAILSWINLSAHKTNIGRTTVNYDGRNYIELPSGKKIKITIKIEECQSNQDVHII